MVQPRSDITRLALALVALTLSSTLVACEGDSFGYSTRKLPSYQINDQAPSTQPSNDAGSQVDATPPPPAAAGSCKNPKCFATQGLCGCKATDGAGNQIVMACQGGGCACLDGNGDDTNDFTATCDDQASAAQAFQQCACN